MYLGKHYIVKRCDNVFVSTNSPLSCVFLLLFFVLSDSYNKFTFSRNIGNVLENSKIKSIFILKFWTNIREVSSKLLRQIWCNTYMILALKYQMLHKSKESKVQLILFLRYKAISVHPPPCSNIEMIKLFQLQHAQTLLK